MAVDRNHSNIVMAYISEDNIQDSTFLKLQVLPINIITFTP